MRGMYFDREGRELADVFAWASLFEDFKYRIVAQQPLGKSVWVSTVWEGLAEPLFRRDDTPPRVFETAVFVGGRLVERTRSASQAEALADHFRFCQRFRDVFGRRIPRRLKKRIKKGWWQRE